MKITKAVESFYRKVYKKRTKEQEKFIKRFFKRANVIVSATIIDLITPGIAEAYKQYGYEEAKRIGLIGLEIKRWWPKQAKMIADLLVDEIINKL